MRPAQRNRFFSTKALGLLQDCSRWRIVSTLLPPHRHALPDRGLVRRRRVAAHAHPYPEILLDLEGTGDYWANGRPVRCSPGTALFLDSGVSHDLGYPPRRQEFLHVWLRITQDCMFAEAHRGGQKTLDATVWECLLPLCETGVDFWRLWADCHATTDPAAHRLRLQTILGGLLSRLIDEGTREASTSEDGLAEAVEAVGRHLRETGGRDATLDELARLAGYSKYYFWRAFKRRTGMSPHQFINCSRIHKVSDWLAEGRSQKEMGCLLGFSGPASFSRWYRKHHAAIAAVHRQDQ